MAGKYFVEKDYGNMPVQLYTEAELEERLGATELLRQARRLGVGEVIPYVNLSGGPTHPTYLMRVTAREFRRIQKREGIA
ncbi:MAG: hypothetical protein H5T97_14320 [Firmicutes bacterium]|nr:hypothetical protein [Bacillota bacterium]